MSDENISEPAGNLLLDLKLTTPSGATDVEIINETISVRGTFPFTGNTADQVKAYCYNSLVTSPDAAPPAGAVSCHYESGDFFHSAIPLAEVASSPSPNNTVFAWHKPSGSSTWNVSVGVQFRGIAPVGGDIEIEVKAPACIAFACAANNFFGPAAVVVGSETIDDSTSRGISARPSQILIPSSAVGGSVDITYDSGTWTHWDAGPAAAKTDADGRNTDPPGLIPTQEEYLVAEYNSDGLTIPDNYLNRLIAVFGDENGYIGNVLDVGSSSQLAIPAGAKYLFLAMHDGYQWNISSNTGSVVVKLVFNDAP